MQQSPYSSAHLGRNCRATTPGNPFFETSCVANAPRFFFTYLLSWVLLGQVLLLVALGVTSAGLVALGAFIGPPCG